MTYVLAKLADSVAGLTYPSDADEPFDVIDWPPGEGDAIAQVKRHTGRHGLAWSAGELFSLLAQTDDAERFAALRVVLYGTLSDVAAVRLAGGVTVDVYVLGRTVAGRWAGVHSVAVET